MWHEIWLEHAWQEHCRSKLYAVDVYLNAIDEMDEINYIMRCVLNVRDRAIFVLWAIDDFNFSEIAQMFRMTKQRVRLIVADVKLCLIMSMKK
jgi:predicted DNA-binding protein YlxM (UPF0122 family)